jgi:hypothetical protein
MLWRKGGWDRDMSRVDKVISGGPHTWLLSINSIAMKIGHDQDPKEIMA